MKTANIIVTLTMDPKNSLGIKDGSGGSNTELFFFW